MATPKNRQGKYRTMPVQVDRATWKRIKRLALRDEVSAGRVVAVAVERTYGQRQGK